MLQITTIAMFAVVLGLGMLSPAMAVKMDKVFVCHHEAEEIDPDTGETIPAFWTILHINGNGLKGHDGKHGDGTTDEFVINTPEDDSTCRGLPNFQETVDEDE